MNRSLFLKFSVADLFICQRSGNLRQYPVVWTLFTYQTNGSLLEIVAGWRTDRASLVDSNKEIGGLEFKANQDQYYEPS